MVSLIDQSILGKRQLHLARNFKRKLIMSTGASAGKQKVWDEMGCGNCSSTSCTAKCASCQSCKCCCAKIFNKTPMREILSERSFIAVGTISGFVAILGIIFIASGARCFVNPPHCIASTQTSAGLIGAGNAIFVLAIVTVIGYLLFKKIKSDKLSWWILITTYICSLLTGIIFIMCATMLRQEHNIFIIYVVIGGVSMAIAGIAIFVASIMACCDYDGNDGC